MKIHTKIFSVLLTLLTLGWILSCSNGSSTGGADSVTKVEIIPTLTSNDSNGVKLSYSPTTSEPLWHAFDDDSDTSFYCSSYYRSRTVTVTFSDAEFPGGVTVDSVKIVPSGSEIRNINSILISYKETDSSTTESWGDYSSNSDGPIPIEGINIEPYVFWDFVRAPNAIWIIEFAAPNNAYFNISEIEFYSNQ